ncbi:MAG: hypothetical protein JST16_11290 [Bdellovibrionales bacterium]|nr:hypothetical protein [Bdellovibrionales bacterium]
MKNGLRVLLLTGLVFSNSAFAKRTYIEMSPAGEEWIVEEIPFGEMAFGNRQKIQRQGLERLMKSFNENDRLVAHLTGQSPEQARRAIAEARCRIDDLVKQMNEGEDNMRQHLGERVLPSAFMFTIGVNIDVAAGIAVGGSKNIAWIVMPFETIIRDRRTLQIIDRFPSWKAAVAGIFAQDFGLGGKVKPPASLRFGGGLIWGPLKEPGNYAGIGVGASVVGGVGILPVTPSGINLKAGVIRNMLMNADFPYVHLNFIMGDIGAEAVVYGNATEIVPYSELLRVLAPAFSGLGIHKDMADFLSNAFGEKKVKGKDSDSQEPVDCSQTEKRS